MAAMAHRLSNSSMAYARNISANGVNAISQSVAIIEAENGVWPLSAKANQKIMAQ